MISKYKTKTNKVRYKIKTYLGIDSKTGKAARIEKQGFKTRKEAENYSLRAVNDFKKYDTLIVNKKIKFEDIYDIWFEQYQLSVAENTYFEEKSRAELHILPKFEGKFVDKITVQDCQEAVNDWYSSYTKAATLVNLTKRIFKLAINMGYTNDNPMENIIRPKNTHKKDYEPSFYDKDQLAKLFECLENESFKKQVIFRVLAYTGLRTSELIGLQWQDIDFSKSTLTLSRSIARAGSSYIVNPAKTKASRRTISLDKKTLDMLSQWQLTQRKEMLRLGYNTNQPDQYIFTNNDNRHLNKYYVATNLKRLIKKYKLPPLTPHGLRHTHCSLLFEAGASIKEVQDRLGHSNVQTTMNIYAHVTKNKKEETADKFAKFMEI